MWIKTLLLLIGISVLRAEERLSWFTKEPEIRSSIFVPDDLPEGKEENRILPLVFHNDESKVIQLKCIMRGYNATNNPSDYKDARWSHPGFDNSLINTNFDPAEDKDDKGIPYAIWTIGIETSSAVSGKKWTTCEFQQGDFPLSIDFKFLIFKRVSKVKLDNGQALLSYGLGEYLDAKDLNQQIEKDIRRQISEHYNMTSSDVTHDGQMFNITVPDPDPPAPPTPEKPTPEDPTPEKPTPEKPTPENPKPEKPTPEKPTPEKPTPEKPTPETPTPVTPNPENPTPEKPTPETPAPVTPKQENPTPEKPTPEMPTPENPTPETPPPEMPTPEKPTPETQTPVMPKPMTPTPTSLTLEEYIQIASIIFLVFIMVMVTVLGAIIACRDDRLKTKYGFGSNHEADLLCKDESARAGLYDTESTEYSVKSDKEEELALNMTNYLLDPKKRIEADMIQEQWRQKSHNPSGSEVKKAALMVSEGYLQSVEYMNIADMNIEDIPRDTMDELSSIVTERVWIDNISHTDQLTSILANVRSKWLQLQNMELSDADTQVLVTAMSRVEGVWLENVTLDMEELCRSYAPSSLSRCRQLSVCGDMRSRYQVTLRRWAAQAGWILTVDNEALFIMEHS